jgi:uncharacterized protein
MNCPKCSATMQSITFKGVEVDKCSSCGGIWFDMLEAEHLRKLSGSEKIDSGDAKVGKEKNGMGKIKCPKDSALMLRMVVSNQPHIWYEACPVCYGTYFDAGEFKDFRAETFVDAVRAIFSKERK